MRPVTDPDPTDPQIARALAAERQAKRVIEEIMNLTHIAYMERCEKIRDIVELCKGNQAAAARLIDVDRANITRALNALRDRQELELYRI